MIETEIIKKIKSAILNHANSNAKTGDINNTEWLFHDNWGINDKTIFDFIQLLEQDFGLHFTDQEITSGNFENVNSISRLIRQKNGCKKPTCDNAGFYNALAGKTISVGLIDSGVALRHPALAGTSVFRYEYNNDSFIESTQQDALGHGTACAYIIKQKAPAVELYSLRVFEQELKCKPEPVFDAIRWCIEREIEIIHLSLGTVTEKFRNDLMDLIETAAQQNTIIAAAKNNAGKESFPADLERLICVTSAPVYGKYDYHFQGGKFQNEFSARGDAQKLAWYDNGYRFSSGNSFAAAHLTGIIALLLEKYGRMKFEQLIEVLREHASIPPKSGFNQKNHHIVTHSKSDGREQLDSETNKLRCIRNVALYPGDIQTKLFLKYRDMLPFEIKAIIKIPGLNLSEPEPLFSKNGVEIVDRVEQVGDTVDSIIAGNLLQASRIKRVDLYEKLFKDCIRFSKNLYIYGQHQPQKYQSLIQDLKKKHRLYLSPFIPNEAYNSLLKEYHAFGNQKILTPVLGIFDISRTANLFEVELRLRKLLRQEGYQVSQMSTDPRASLFGFDACYPLNMPACANMGMDNIVRYFEIAIKKTALKKPDIILASCSGNLLLKHNENNMAVMRFISFLSGTRPDACILVTSDSEQIEKIKQTIDVLNTMAEIETLHLLISPVNKANIQSQDKLKNQVIEQLSISCTATSDISHNKDLLKSIQNYFSG